MIDIETLDTCPDAVVMTVGGVKFDPYTQIEPHSPVHYRLNIDDQADRSISDATIEWWAKQDDHIRDEAFSEDNRISVMDFFKDLNRWLVGCDEIWCQGPQFDMVILENLFNQFKHHYNWAFWQIRDSRTLFSIMPKDPRKDIQQNLHNATADAYYQAVCVQRAFKHFGVTRR